MICDKKSDKLGIINRGDYLIKVVIYTNLPSNYTSTTKTYKIIVINFTPKKKLEKFLEKFFGLKFELFLRFFNEKNMAMDFAAV